MKRVVLFFVVSFVVLLNISCSKTMDIDDNNSKHATPENMPTSTDYSITDSVAKEQEFKWLKFSLTDYEKERNIVKDYFSESIKDIKETYGDDTVNIGISKEDINGDGQKDIVLLFMHQFFSGYNTNSLMGIFIVDKNTTTYEPVVQAFVRIDELSSQKEIGVRNDGKSKWKQFIVNGNIFSWGDTGYENISVKNKQ